MKDRLLPLVATAVLACTLVGGFMIVSSSGARPIAVASAAGEQSSGSPVSGVAAGMAPPTKPARSISSARPPVPLVRRHHAAQYVENPRQPEVATEGVVTNIPEAAGSSAAQAKAMIEADGYRNVQALVRTADGAWRGSALRGATEVAVNVDSSGRVWTQ
jgi:hypothetical protein